MSETRIIDLEFVRSSDMPFHPAHKPGYSYFLHRRHTDAEQEKSEYPIKRTSSSGLLVMPEHSGTHVDALCHQAEDLKFYGCDSLHGVESSAGYSQGDAVDIPVFHHPGTLIDVAALYDDGEVPPATLIDLDTVKRALDRQGSEIRSGSVVLVHTGNAKYWDRAERYTDGPGMSAEVSQWLADQRVAAVGADNMAWDLFGPANQGFGSDGPGHVILLVRYGIYIFENVKLDELAAGRVYDFTFFATPMKLRGATGSPIRPLALVGGLAD